MAVLPYAALRGLMFAGDLLLADFLKARRHSQHSKERGPDYAGSE
jgi:hypothetical protein